MRESGRHSYQEEGRVREEGELEQRNFIAGIFCLIAADFQLYWFIRFALGRATFLSRCFI